jgi:hypothetical protein
MNNTWALDSIDNRWSEYLAFFLWDLLSFFIVGKSCFIANSEILEVIEECIDETPLSPLFSRSGMSIHPCIFVDDGEVIIFKNDIDRNVLRNELHIFNDPVNLDHISAVDFFILRKLFSIRSNLPFLDHLLDVAA